MTQADLINALPAILKFGVTGLSAIVFILAYQLMKQVIAKTKPAATRALIGLTRSFMWISLAFCGLSAVAAAFQQYWDKQAIATEETLVRREHVIAQSAAAAIASRFASWAGKDQMLENAVEEWPSGIEENRQPALVNEGIELRPIALDSPLSTTVPDKPVKVIVVENEPSPGGPGPSLANRPHADANSTMLTQADLDYRKLRRAVFESYYDFQADKVILDSALTMLLGEYPEFEEIKGRILETFGDLRSARLRWLRDKAIPALEKEFKDWGSRQETPYAKVSLPKEIRIADEMDATAIVEDLDLLEAELQLLKNAK